MSLFFFFNCCLCAYPLSQIFFFLTTVDITSDTIAKDYLSRAYTEQLGSIFLLFETLEDHGSLDHALSTLNLAQNQAKLFIEEFS